MSSPNGGKIAQRIVMMTITIDDIVNIWPSDADNALFLKLIDQYIGLVITTPKNGLLFRTRQGRIHASSQITSGVGRWYASNPPQLSPEFLR